MYFWLASKPKKTKRLQQFATSKLNKINMEMGLINIGPKDIKKQIEKPALQVLFNDRNWFFMFIDGNERKLSGYRLLPFFRIHLFHIYFYAHLHTGVTNMTD